MVSRPLFFAVIAVLCLASPAAARAAGPAVAGAPFLVAAPPPDDPWHVDVAAGTELPIAMGGMVTAELPYRILLRADLGLLPKPYAYLIDDFLRAVGSYSDLVSKLIRAGLGDSAVVRLGAGWRPFEDHGFEVLGGYTLVTLGGSLSARDTIQAFLEAKGSEQEVPSDEGRGIPLHATLHSFHVTLGWRWLLWDDRLVLRASLTYLQCVAASSGVDITARSLKMQARVNAVNQEINGYLSPYFTTWVKAPVVGLSLGYRF